MIVTKHPNGKDFQQPYLVTVAMEHFVEVKARNADEAGRKALEEMGKRWGRAKGPRVIEVEEI